jgi:CMP-N-acetylneuraminic acid synthetase
MKPIKDVCFVIQARLDSKRTPRKCIRPFANSTLFNVAIENLLDSNIIPKENIYVSVYEQELIDIANEYGVNVYTRSYESAFDHGWSTPQVLYEWYDKLPHKYVVFPSICNPLMTIKTIDKFTEQYLSTESDGLFAVVERKNYYWDKNANSITDWQDRPIMNTSLVEPIYEAAHCLYASKMDMIGEGCWMDRNSPPTPELFVMEESEFFDIDYPWQFEMVEILYKKQKKYK